MKTIDRMHHVCLTVSSESFEETWPKELAFFADFLRMPLTSVLLQKPITESQN